MTQTAACFAASLMYTAVAAAQPTALEELAGSLAPGDWAEMTTENIDSALAQAGAGVGNIAFGSNSAGWDDNRRVLHFVGKTAGSSLPYKYAVYDELTNRWEVRTPPPGTAGHGYDGNAVDPRSGAVFYRPYGMEPTLYILRPGSSWTDDPWPAAGYIQVALGTTVWEGAFDGVTDNAFIVYNCGEPEIQIYDIAAAEWRAPITGLAGTSTYHCAAEHSVARGVTIFGGGNANPTAVWRLDSDRSVTALADAPFAYGGYLEAGVVAEPVTGDFLFIGSGQMWVLDPTGSGTWTRSADVPAGIPSPAVDSQDALLAPVRRYGVVMYVGCETACRVWLYRHAPGASPPPPFDAGGIPGDAGTTGDGGPIDAGDPIDAGEAGATSDAGARESGGGCACTVERRDGRGAGALLALVALSSLVGFRVRRRRA